MKLWESRSRVRGNTILSVLMTYSKRWLMTDDSTQDGVPDSDPTHIDPAGALADLIATDLSGIALSEEQDPAEIREFITSVEDSDDPADPGTNAAVRIARAVLEQAESNE
jgi:hypothetical protein